MKYTIVVTVLVVLVNSFCQAVAGLIMDHGPFAGSEFMDALGYHFILPAIIFFFPILISVLCFKVFFKNSISPKNSLLKYLVRSFLIMLIVLTGLIFWTMLDMPFQDTDGSYTLHNIYFSFKNYYLSLLPAGFSIPIAILFIDFRYSMPNIRRQA